MKTLTIIFCFLRKKNITFYLNSSVILTLVLFLFSTTMTGLVTTCYAQSPWTQKADMLVPRGWHSSCVLDGKIYAIGGVPHNESSSYRTVQVYDPILNSWISRASMTAGRASFATCVVNGKIWAIGGASRLWFNSINSIEEYNPVTDTWTHITYMPRERQGHTASLVDGKIYIIGGGATYENAIAEVDVYDTLTKTWTTVSPMPTPRMYLKAVVLNDTIYTIGGHEGAKNNETSVPIVQAYHPATDTWKEKASMITGRRYFSASVINGKIYVIGGKLGGSGVYTFTTHVEEYDPKTDTWIEMSKLPAEYLRAHAADTLNSKIFVFGGTFNYPLEFPIIMYPTTYTYNPHNDLLVLIEKTEVDKNYARPGIDSICIKVDINDPAGVTLLAEIEAADQTPVDSLQLFDDGTHNDGNAGDSLFANVWPVSFAEERHYYVDLKITRTNVDTVFNYLNSISKFTTIGPVTLENYSFVSTDTVFDPGDRIDIKITLKNNGSTATAVEIKAKLTSLDTLVNVSSWSRTFGDIAPGESSTSDYYRVMIDDEWTGISQVPILVEISSNDYVYWKDTLIIAGVTDVHTLGDPGAHPIKIYPNPSEDILNIEINNTGKQGLEIEIISITGALIYQKEYKNINPNFAEQIDLSGYSKGIYLVKVRQADSVYVGKVVVK